MQKAHRLPISVLLDHGQVGVQADAHRGIKGHLEGCAVVLGPNHGPQLLAIHRLLHLLEEPPERLPVTVCLKLQPDNTHTLLRKSRESALIDWKKFWKILPVCICLEL